MERGRSRPNWRKSQIVYGFDPESGRQVPIQLLARSPLAPVVALDLRRQLGMAIGVALDKTSRECSP